MFFFFKRRKIVIDCFTNNGAMNDLYPIDYTIKFLPKWWKSTPSTFKVNSKYGVDLDIPTIKHCPSFKQLYQTGFIIPIWCDLEVRTTDNEWKAEFSDQTFNLDYHSVHQLPKEYNDYYFNFKIQSPWLMKEKTGIKFLWNNVLWNNFNNLHKYMIVQGMIEFKNNHSCNINFMIPRKDSSISIQSGTPLVQVIPLTEHKIQIKRHVIDTNEYEKIKRYDPVSLRKFISTYNTHKKIILDNESKKKCPFGFGK